ncbi:MAG TPA: fumarylacetoacetate hydrolase family protein [Armatimonadota bacterium]|jgi:2-keto-4-pentenoate hydratase/2-oxohepta-3-ene-1,7-dioic acid hydratase in catechol pathway
MALRLVNFLPAPTAAPRVGLWIEGGLLDLNVALEVSGRSSEHHFASVAETLGDPLLLDIARALAASVPVDPTPRENCRLLAPVPQPGKLFALAGNYLAHIEESATTALNVAMEREWRGGPRVFMKPSVDTVVGDGDPVILAKTATFLDYEAELAVIIGKSGRYIPAEQALAYVGGITALNDISERQLSVWDRGEFATAYKWFDWLNGKWTDTGAPMGPCAVPLSDVPDLDALQLSLDLNGETLQQARLGEMIFKIPEVVAYISSICTLRPGDVIAMGTPAGVGMARDRKLQDGDVMQVHLDLVGTLTNPVQADRS